MEIVQIIDECLFKYYSGKGMSVPKWKLRKDPEWWIQYLKDVGEE